MTTYTTQINGTALVVDITAEGRRADLENEGQGLSTFGVTIEAIRRIVPKDFAMIQTNEYREHSQPLVEVLTDGSDLDADDIYDEDSDPGEVIYCSDPDAMIVLMALAADKGEPLSLEWQSEGSTFWLLHDIEHTRADCWVDRDYNADGAAGINFPVEGRTEQSASVRAALEAIRTGVVDVSEVLAEITDNAKPFDERFGYEPTTLDDVLASCTLTLKV